MSSYFYKQLRAKLSVIMAIMLTVTMFPVPFAGSLLVHAEAAEPPAEYTYMFIDAYSGDSNLRVLGDINEKPITRKVDLYGTSIAADAVGQSRSFDFDVPRTGYYLLEFQGYLYKAAGIGDLFIDEERIGRYDFYDPGSMFGPTVPLKTVYLTEGTHTITFQVAGRNPMADKGSNYSLYPYKFSLIEQEGLPSLQLSVSAAKQILLMNETTSVQASVYKSDGTPVNQTTFSYASENDHIASIDESGLITGLAEGSSVIHVQAEADGLKAVQSLNIQVVNSLLESVELGMDGGPLPLMGTRQLHVSGMLSNGADADLSGAEMVFYSSDPQTIRVDETGQVTGLKKGTAVIQVQVTLAGRTVSAELPIEVTDSRLAGVQLKLDKDDVVQSQYVKASVEGVLDNGEKADLSQAEIVFTSSNDQVLLKKTEGGFFKAVGVGAAAITVDVTFAGVTQSDGVTVEVGELTSSKTRSTFYTEEKVANARNNVQQYEWAKGHRSGAVSAAAKYVEAGWDFLWKSVPPQTLPRSYAVNQPLGSPVSGKEIDKWGNYPYKADPFNEPWKLIDPSAVDENGKNYRYPTNDFKSYYESGLDEQGIFRRELADPQYLVNELYPEKGETWGVDDGYGWVDENGNYYTFISYYTHWHLWYSNGVVVDAIKALRDAYIFTGEKQYAQAGIVLLDRIADVYPSLDLRVFDRSIYWHSDGGRAGGKAVGSIWETGLVKEFIKAYDAFFPAMDDPEVMDEVLVFLQQKGEQYKLSFKDSATGIRKNIEDGILKEVYPNVKNANIFGNNGFHQSALALAAVVYDTLPETKEWLDFNFQSGGLLSNPYRVTGGNILAGLVNTVDRDGHGNEGSPGYNRLWISSFLEVANILEGYDKYPEADLYQNVKFRKMFSAMYPLTMLERYTPSIGDTAAAGNPVHVLDLAQMIRAYEVYREPIFAQLAYFLNNYRASGIHGDVFTENPEQIGKDIEAVIAEIGPLDLESTNLSGFGYAGLSQLETWKNQVVDLSGEPWAEKAFETAKAGAMLDGKLLAMPYNIEGYGLVYNKDIFKQLNIEPPKTLSELREAARTLKEAGYIPFATGFGEWWVIGIHLMNVAFAHQPDQDAFLQGLNDGSAHFADNPVFQQFKDLFDTIIEYGDPNPLTNDYNTQVSLFATGKAAMMQQGNWMEPQVFEINPDMNMGLLPIPINDDAEAMDKLHVGVPFNWVINKDSKNIDEAKQFLNWLVTDETAQSYMTEKFLFIPAYNHIEADNLKGLSQDVMNYSKAGKTLPWVFPKWPEGVDNQFSSAMQGYVGKQNSYEEMLKQIQSSWDELKK